VIAGGSRIDSPAQRQARGAPRARALLSDGRRPDPLPLAVGDRVLMVLSAPDCGSNAPNGPANINPTYSASIVERLVVGDKVTTH